MLEGRPGPIDCDAETWLEVSKVSGLIPEGELVMDPLVTRLVVALEAIKLLLVPAIVLSDTLMTADVEVLNVDETS